MSDGKICYAATAAKSLQSCPTLCNPIDGSPPGSSDPGILQARTLEWVAIAFSIEMMKKHKFQQITTPSMSWISRSWRMSFTPTGVLPVILNTSP